MTQPPYELPDTFEFRYPPNHKYEGSKLYPCCLCGEQEVAKIMLIHWPSLRLIKNLFPDTYNVCNHMLCRQCYEKEDPEVTKYWASCIWAIRESPQ